MALISKSEVDDGCQEFEIQHGHFAEEKIEMAKYLYII